MSSILKYRFSILSQVPRWLKGFWGSRILYAIGLFIDDLGDTIDQGLKFSFPYPGSGPGNALALIGQDRGIIRGPKETDDTYAKRLTYWRLSRRRKGNAFALMEQLQAFLQPYPVKIRIQYDNGTRYTLIPGGWVYAQTGYETAPSGTVIFDTHTWNWDGTSNPNRFWVTIYDTSNSLWNRDGTWADSGFWNDLNTNDGTSTGAVLDPLSTDTTPTYGSTASYSTVQAILSLVTDWSPPHSTPVSVILAFDNTSFDAISPGGNWGNPGNRSLSYVYWEP